MTTRSYWVITSALVALALGGCAAGGERVEVSAGRTLSPAGLGSPYVPVGVDPAGEGCATLRLLGVVGTPEQYRAAAAALAGSADRGLAAAAIALHDATGSSLAQVDRLAMIDAVLDLDEQCLRVTG